MICKTLTLIMLLNADLWTLTDILKMRNAAKKCGTCLSRVEKHPENGLKFYCKGDKND